MKTKKYPYWIYYIPRKSLESISNFWYDDEGHECPIYAYTDNEKYADMFEEMYDMKLFVRKKLMLSGDDIRELALSQRNKMLTTTSIRGFKRRKPLDIDVVLTMNDKFLLQSTLLDHTVKITMKLRIPQPEIINALTPDVYHALEDLGIVRVLMFREGIIDADPMNPESMGIYLDELAIFISLFSPILDFKRKG